jgi:2-polyprenyl-6-methoxyphenol hydroxylase-like FAD-dependent oxidoreductase
MNSCSLRQRADGILIARGSTRCSCANRHSEFKSACLVAQKKWQLSIRTSGEDDISIEAAFVVDATGRRAEFAAQQGVRKVLLDRSVGLFVFFDFEKHEALTDTYTLVEACEDGWWYSAMLPGDKLVVACVTDADIARKRGLNEARAWFEFSGETLHVKNRVRKARALSSPVAHSASSHRLERMTGTAWLTVGDAASTFDPLSSQGILKGMRSGIVAAYAIGDYFKNSALGLEKYEALIAKEFEDYLSIRADFYRREQRWADAPFWKRRSDYITLDPGLVLRSTAGADESPAENLSMHLPVTDLLYLCSTPRAAREVVSEFNCTKRFPDRRVVLALQYLVEEGVINADPEPLAVTSG